jgi:hypothetical protein
MPTARPGQAQPSRLTATDKETDPAMSRAPQADPEIDSLTAEITVDCYDEHEVLTAFENAFYDARLPCPGTVIGEDVEVLSVSTSNNRRELIATCQRAGRRHEIALLDIDIHADPPTSRLLAAYRHWVGD